MKSSRQLTASRAFGVAEHEHPDLILMDLSLPVIDGWEATRRIKANAALCNIPIIALSAHAMIGDEERALQSGCNDYLSKPLDEGLFRQARQVFGAGVVGRRGGTGYDTSIQDSDCG